MLREPFVEELKKAVPFFETKTSPHYTNVRAVKRKGTGQLLQEELEIGAFVGFGQTGKGAFFVAVPTDDGTRIEFGIRIFSRIRAGDEPLDTQ